MITQSISTRILKTFISTIFLLATYNLSAFEARPIQAGFDGPIYVNDQCKLGITVYHQDKANNTQIILHEGLNNWVMLSNGAIVLKDNHKLGLTVYHQNITNNSKIILHEGYNLWEVLSNGAIVLKGNPKFGLTVKNQNITNNAELILHEGYNTWREKYNPAPTIPTTNSTEKSAPIFVNGGGGLGVTVRYQEIQNGTKIILHEGVNRWIMLSNGAIVLDNNREYGLTVLNQNITNDAKIILHKGYNLWKVLSNGAIVLKDNEAFGLTVKHQNLTENTEIILHKGYNTWSDEFIAPNLTLVTYNTHLFKGSIAERAAEKVGKTVIFEDASRMEKICLKLNTLDADIVCLQEVWGTDYQKQIKSKLSGKYPHIYIVPDVGTSTGDAVLNSLFNTLSGTSGLMVASKFPIVGSYFKMYEDPNPSANLQVQIEREDSWAKKGVCVLVLEANVPGVGRPFLLRVATTHSFTGLANGEAAYCSEVAADYCFNGFNDGHRSFGIRRPFDGGGIILEYEGGEFSFDENTPPPMILAGDFNLHRTHEERFTNLMGVMQSHGAVEAIQQKEPNDFNAENTYTTWTAENELSLALNSQASGKKDRIDYIFYKDAGVLELKEARVIHDWTLDNGIDLSDHYPVLATFEINEQNIETIPKKNSYRIEIDACRTGLDNEGTNTPVLIEFYSGSRLVSILSSTNMEPNCDEVNDNEYQLTTRSIINHIKVRALGEDALFIDEVSILCNGSEVKHYGAENGNGWCLSTDVNDAPSWEDKKSGTGGKCWSVVGFDL